MSLWMGIKPELNLSAQRCLMKFLLGILIFKGLTKRRLYKSFGVKGLNVGDRFVAGDSTFFFRRVRKI
jgi:hypothetical protein